MFSIGIVELTLFGMYWIYEIGLREQPFEMLMFLPGMVLRKFASVFGPFAILAEALDGNF